MITSTGVKNYTDNVWYIGAKEKNNSSNTKRKRKDYRPNSRKEMKKSRKQENKKGDYNISCISQDCIPTLWPLSSEFREIKRKNWRISLPRCKKTQTLMKKQQDYLQIKLLRAKWTTQRNLIKKKIKNLIFRLSTKVDQSQWVLLLHSMGT